MKHVVTVGLLLALFCGCGGAKPEETGKMNDSKFNNVAIGTGWEDIGKVAIPSTQPQADGSGEIVYLSDDMKTAYVFTFKDWKVASKEKKTDPEYLKRFDKEAPIERDDIEVPMPQ